MTEKIIEANMNIIKRNFDIMLRIKNHHDKLFDMSPIHHFLNHLAEYSDCDVMISCDDAVIVTKTNSSNSQDAIILKIIENTQLIISKLVNNSQGFIYKTDNKNFDQLIFQDEFNKNVLTFQILSGNLKTDINLDVDV